MFSVKKGKDGAVKIGRPREDDVFTLKQVEAAVIALHDIPESRRSAFSGRAQNLRKVGLLPSSAGKGFHVSYDVFDLLHWVLVFEFYELGLSPAEIDMALTAVSPLAAKAFAEADAEDDKILWMNGDFFSRSMKVQAGEKPGEVIVGVALASQFGSGVFGEKKIRRALTINLSDLKRRLAAVLPVQWPTEFAYIDKGGLHVATMSRGAAAADGN